MKKWKLPMPLSVALITLVLALTGGALFNLASPDGDSEAVKALRSRGFTTITVSFENRFGSYYWVTVGNCIVGVERGPRTQWEFAVYDDEYDEFVRHINPSTIRQIPEFSDCKATS